MAAPAEKVKKPAEWTFEPLDEIPWVKEAIAGAKSKCPGVVDDPVTGERLRCNKLNSVRLVQTGDNAGKFFLSCDDKPPHCGCGYYAWLKFDESKPPNCVEAKVLKFQNWSARRKRARSVVPDSPLDIKRIKLDQKPFIEQLNKLVKHEIKHNSFPTESVMLVQGYMFEIEKEDVGVMDILKYASLVLKVINNNTDSILASAPPS